ncbi:MBL fold metallo-hydrolase [Mucilaginibacter gynuensis]|uniref:MBL fold metallo-hydrolase n=1 Tax=Mucilaginibacter gynuensis TaxID=1302236 RepID=A0ABP8HFS2_9SPHI
MKLKVISSSSAGNCYLLYNANETLILECGVKASHIKQALNFDLSKVVGVLVTHEHKDHCVAAADMVNAALNIYSSAGTLKAFGFKSTRLHAVENYKEFQLGGFKIKAFDAVHDCAEPVNYLIEHEEMGRLVFITDSYYCKYSFPHLNNIIIEANYSQAILDKKLADGATPDFLRNRVLQSHMSLDTCKQFLSANDLRGVNNIVLCHLSESNSNAVDFKQQVKNHTGKAVHIADKGLTINFDKTPF